MSDHARAEMLAQLARGTAAGEDFYRLQVSGEGRTKHVNITPAELAGIAEVLTETGDLPVPCAFTPAELETVAEALDSHLYWQISPEDRRDSGYVQEPMTEEERAIERLEDRVRAMAANAEAVTGWIAQARARLVDDSDAVADVDLIYGLYRALTGEDIDHPYEVRVCEECGSREDDPHVNRAKVCPACGNGCDD